MRLAVLACIAALGCSSPAPQDEGPAPWHYTRDSAIDQAEDDAPGAVYYDTGADTYAPDAAPPADTAPTADAATDTAPPADTYVCSPAIAVTACTLTVPIITSPCGVRPDGCGGTVACAACAGNRRCVTSAASLGHCACSPIVGKLCQTLSDATGQMWECPADVVPTNTDAKLYAQPKASISWWCSPTGG